eukprot:SAG11_NODE_28701_length_318_cov_24.872146_1_plen_37_part_01
MTEHTVNMVADNGPFVGLTELQAQQGMEPEPEGGHEL